MSITTAGDLINYCFRVSGVSGVGQGVTADDATDALETLSEMLAQWQQKRWLAYTLAETVLTSTGASSYTIGTGGDFSVARPDRLEAAFVRYLAGTGTPIDYPISIIGSREDYNRIALKSFAAWPSSVFYESTYPLGILHFWPVASTSAYELHIFSKGVLPPFTALTDLLTIPAEYREALKYGLVARITMDYGLDPKPAHVAAYRAALATIRQSNTQIPAARMPPGLPGMRRGGGIGNDMVGQGFGRAFILDGGATI